MTLTTFFILFGLLSVSQESFSESYKEIVTVQKKWVRVNYLNNDDVKKREFDTLMVEADSLVKNHPNSAQAYLWRGIIRSSFAGVKGGLDGIALANSAKNDLEHAIELKPDDKSGLAYSSLGVLYFKVPGWPIGFGSHDKAEEFLKKGLQLNPDGIDGNYFYAEYLIDNDRYVEAEHYLIKAQQAAPRPKRPIADRERHIEINTLLDYVRTQIDRSS